MAPVDGLLSGVGLRAKLIEHENADCRRQVGRAPSRVDLLQQGGHRRVFLISDLAHAVPKFIFERHAGFVPGQNDRAFDDGGFHGRTTFL